MGSGVWPLAVATRLAKPPEAGAARGLAEAGPRIGSGGPWVWICEDDQGSVCGAGPCLGGRRAGAGMALAAARGRVSGCPARRDSVRIGRVRAISTGQLHGLLRFHLRPIDVVVFHGSRRDLVLRRVSRLDAFSGYPVRT